MTIQFEREVQEATFYSPLEDFASVTVETEVRIDPLTGRSARVVTDNFLMPEEDPDLEPVVGDSEGCFFCPGLVTDATPTYPDWVGFERGEVGEAVSFPNLNPYGAHSNVVVLTEDHFRPIDAFPPEVFENGLSAALEYLEAVFEHDDTASVASVNMNFLRPAGSSIIHPHMQTLADDRGTNVQRRRFDAAHRYRDEHERGFWTTLLEAEREGDRYIGRTGPVEWIAPFAPTHHRHVQGIALSERREPSSGSPRSPRNTTGTSVGLRTIPASRVPTSRSSPTLPKG
ncbi:MAG: hypothetical protein R3324_12395, partial [Halobacteriales archaeon]|nr:hypothetical protein [Halobacteriales archaeon]